MKRRFTCYLLTFILVLASGPVLALTISQTGSFSTAGSEAIGVTPFNAASGTLDQVRVSISGEMKLDVDAGGLYNDWMQPMGYNFNVSVVQILSGLGGMISFGAPITTVFPVGDPGFGMSYSFTKAFTYNFIFDDAADLAGFTSAYAINYAQVLLPISAPSEPDSVSLSSNGTMVIEYDYTPKSTSPVPEPATMLLLGLGLPGLLGLRKKSGK